MEDKNINELCYEHIKQKRFIEVKKILLELDINSPNINFLWGLFYDDSDNEEYSKYRAKEKFGKVYDSGEANIHVFLRLAYLTEYKYQRVNILKKGLEKYSNSKTLFYWLLKETDREKRNAIFDQIEEHDIKSLPINLIKIDTYSENKNYDKLLPILIEVFEKMDFKEFNLFLQGISLYELKRYDKAKLIFENLIKDDIRHHLEFAPYYLLCLCYIQSNEIKEAFKIFDLIPINSISDDLFVYANNYESGIVYEVYIIDVLSLLLQNTKSKKIIGKIKLFQTIYFYEKKGKIKLRDAKSAFKIYPDNLELCKILMEYYENNNRYLESYNIFIVWIKNIKSWEYKDKLNGYFYEFKFVTESMDKEFYEIISLLKTFFDESYYKSEISQTLIEPIIERLYKEKKYQKVIELSKGFSNKNLEIAEVLFEVAYSYSEVGNIDKAEEIYLQLLEKNSTSSTLNNLGVIYEKKKEFEKAKEYFDKALKAEPNDKLCKNNKERMVNKIQEEWNSNLEYIGDDITLENFEEIGYDKKLIDILKKSTSSDFQYMIERDLKENAIALCTKCYKTSLIMSGSIVEAFLFNKIHHLGLERYELENGRTKRVNQMSLNEFLYVSLKENIISTQLHHLAHGIRDFRNIVHPGLEIRKISLQVNSENAHLAWTIVKKIIVES